LASAGVVTGTVTLTASFNEYISSGITPYTINEVLGALGVLPGALQLGNGTGSLQIDTLYAAKLTLAATTTTIDFTSVVDPGGASVTFARGRFFTVFNPDPTAGHDIKIYQGASNPWAPLPSSANPGWARYGGGWYTLSDPTSTGTGNGNVITSTSKTAVFDSGANTVTFYVIMAGGSVA
jgi:hypothetical protein